MEKFEFGTSHLDFPQLCVYVGCVIFVALIGYLLYRRSVRITLDAEEKTMTAVGVISDVCWWICILALLVLVFII